MKTIRTVSLAAIILLSGCDMAADMGDMMGKMEKVNEALQTELNMNAEVGWNVHNGTLTQVTVMFPAQSVTDKTVQELKDSAYPIIRRHFDEAPRVFQVMVAFPMQQ